MSGLVLKLSPKERVLINGAVIENGDRRSRLSIMTPGANILRLRDAIAGLIGSRLFVRDDTPVHSLLHEGCHYICMDSARRARLDTDADRLRWAVSDHHAISTGALPDLRGESDVHPVES